jgi:hypothetical protein
MQEVLWQPEIFSPERGRNTKDLPVDKPAKGSYTVSTFPDVP